jgi:hypothetical protein
VSCNCNDPGDRPQHSKEKCVHLREAEDKVKNGFHDGTIGEATAAHLAVVAEEQGCCCGHGGQCSCALLKKDHCRSGDVTPPHGPAVKPKLETTKSDGSITVFQNGHHKPVHRKNHLAHECGMPYKMPIPRAKTDQNISAKARRSVDSLALDNNMMFNPSAFTPQTSAPFNNERRTSKSEQHSPKIFAMGSGCNGLGHDDLAAIDFSNLAPVQTNQSMQSTTSDAFGYTAVEPLSAMAESTFDPWSAFPSADSNVPNNNPFGVWPTNHDAVGLAQPALTAASSGTQSEIDEIPPIDDAFTFDAMPSIQEDTGSFNLDALQESGSPQSNRRSLPANFFKAVPEGVEWPTTFDNLLQGGPQQQQNVAHSLNIDDMWEGSNLPSITDAPKHHSGGLPNTTRPVSRSVGPTAAPSDDILRSLFPDMDLNGNYLASDSNQVISSGDGQMSFSGMDENNGFTSQPWSDGSVSVPADPFTSPYDLDNDFSNPDFSGNWIQ